MEDYFYLYTSFFSGWKKHYFILHEDTIIFKVEKELPIKGSIHLKVAVIKYNNPKDPLCISIDTGTNEIFLRALNIGKKVQWINALKEA
jgi:hypothetical protein